MAVCSRAIAVSSRLMAEAVASLHLGRVEGQTAVVVLDVVVPIMALVLLGMVKDQMMMEEEWGRLFPLLVHQAHPLSF